VLGKGSADAGEEERSADHGMSWLTCNLSSNPRPEDTPRILRPPKGMVTSGADGMGRGKAMLSMSVRVSQSQSQDTLCLTCAAGEMHARPDERSCNPPRASSGYCSFRSAAENATREAGFGKYRRTAAHAPAAHRLFLSLPFTGLHANIMYHPACMVRLLVDWLSTPLAQHQSLTV
jgi:hypothetical protein